MGSLELEPKMPAKPATTNDSLGQARYPVQHALDRRPIRRPDDAAARKTRLDENRLLLGELTKSKLAMIVPLSGGAHAAERQLLLGNVQQGIVDGHTARDGSGQ